MNPLAEARARVIEACDGLDASLTERSWIDPDDVRFLLGAFTREDVEFLCGLHNELALASDYDAVRHIAARIEALLPPEPVNGPGDPRDTGPLDIPNDWTPTPKRAK